MPDLVDLLLRHTWWSWSDGDRSWHSLFVHGFNLFEGTVWLAFAVIVELFWVSRMRVRPPGSRDGGKPAA